MTRIWILWLTLDSVELFISVFHFGSFMLKGVGSKGFECMCSCNLKCLYCTYTDTGGSRTTLELQNSGFFLLYVEIQVSFMVQY